jgi:hypothetical protein
MIQSGRNSLARILTRNPGSRPQGGMGDEDEIAHSGSYRRPAGRVDPLIAAGAASAEDEPSARRPPRCNGYRLEYDGTTIHTSADPRPHAPARAPGSWGRRRVVEERADGSVSSSIRSALTASDSPASARRASCSGSATPTSIPPAAPAVSASPPLRSEPLHRPVRHPADRRHSQAISDLGGQVYSFLGDQARSRG